MKKKVMALVMVAAVASLMAVGCGSKTKETEEKPPRQLPLQLQKQLPLQLQKQLPLQQLRQLLLQQLRQLLRRQLRQLPLQQLRQLQKQQPRQLLRQLLRHNFLEYRKGLPGNSGGFFARKKGLTNPQGMNKLVTVKKIS